MSKITQKILSKIDCEDLFTKLDKLSQSDLNSLLIELYDRKTKEMSPSDVLKNYKTNRFSKPSDIDPVVYHNLEINVLNQAKNLDIKPILLSPVAPLGSCSVFGAVDQKNVVSATRGSEVLSDSTNMMAIYIADKLKSGEFNNRENDIHICSTNRFTRAQVFEIPGFIPHFGIYCMVSSGKDRGSYQCEIDLLLKQIEFYDQLFKSYSEFNPSISLSKRKGYTDSDGFFDKVVEAMKNRLPHMNIIIDESKQDNQYYKGVNYKIIIETENGPIDIVDGGFVDWTQRMLSNKKERFLISGIGLDLLLIFGKDDN